LRFLEVSSRGSGDGLLKCCCRALLMPIVATLMAMAASTAPALADGYCGHDPTGPTACGIDTSETVTGTYSTDFASDYYVFFARKGTQLTLTVNDTEDPFCSESGVIVCGDVYVSLLDSSGKKLGVSGRSTPDNGVPVPRSITNTLRSSGVYYAVVFGDVGSNPEPYSLTVAGSPNVTWPHPCVVPKLRRHTHLGTAKGRLRISSCSVGKIKRAHNRSVPRGDVIRLASRAGTIIPHGAKVGILVSKGR